MYKTRNYYHYVVTTDSPLGVRQVFDELRLSTRLMRTVVSVSDLPKDGQAGSPAAAPSTSTASDDAPATPLTDGGVDVAPFTALIDGCSEPVLISRNADEDCAWGEGTDGVCDPTDLRYRV